MQNTEKQTFHSPLLKRPHSKILKTPSFEKCGRVVETGPKTNGKQPVWISSAHTVAPPVPTPARSSREWERFRCSRGQEERDWVRFISTSQCLADSATLTPWPRFSRAYTQMVSETRRSSWANVVATLRNEKIQILPLQWNNGNQPAQHRNVFSTPRLTVRYLSTGDWSERRKLLP